MKNLLWRFVSAVAVVISFSVVTSFATIGLAQTSSDDASSTTSQQTVTERITTIKETDTKIVEQQKNTGVITAAIFVKNRADGVPDSKVSVLEDLITGHLTDNGFRIISREDVVNSVASFAGAGANQGDPNLAGAELDKLMSNNTSATRLAQNLNADYILVAAIDTYGSDQIQYDEGDIHTLITDTKMTITYKLLDSGGGGSVSAGVVTVSKKDRQQPGLSVQRDLIDNLLTEAAEKLSRVLSDKAAAGRVAAVAPVTSEFVQFDVVVTMADLSVPITSRGDNGDYNVSTNATIEVPATVEVDGVAVGTAPGPLQARPGLHKVRISAAGFKDWNYTTNIFSGQRLNVAMQLDEVGYQRWGESSAFLEGLKDKAKITNAEADKIEGIAQMFRQSGFKIDIKKDIYSHSESNISGAPAAPASPQYVPVIPVLPVVPVAPVTAAPATQPQH